MDEGVIAGWFAGRLPEGWFEGPPEVRADRDEILIVGSLKEVDAGKDASEAQLAEARSGRIKQFREDTRERRMRIAREAEHRFRRKVSWGAECGGQRELFTTLSLPMMTRLRMPERQVPAPLGWAGRSRSRSHALAWCVRLVAEKKGEWLKDLEQALQEVQKVRSAGPV